ncbi:Csu type fimbrial protein [Paralcaligenes ureilyticus]|uniref:Spore coat protein U-like protein n=1 Tax=Paralcaligenes ureilyticus TaxID=627131 RepID=A0A4R3LV78_9BURK|nr:spore coat protein U domain-containing protein [Paralcaligenes ureilyticus]TCT04461.1 spore coat protein U-like protein [Paralcaligenes ureilyticus]
MNHSLSALVALVAGLTFSVVASAATPVTGGTFNVKIAITAECSMGTGTNTAMDFGSAGSTSATTPTETTAASFQVKCTNLTPYTIGLQPGNANLLGAGQMAGAINTGTKIGYQLYQDAGHATIWGNTPGVGGNLLSATGTGSLQTYSAYGKLLASISSLNLPVDNYSDTVAITVYY